MKALFTIGYITTKRQSPLLLMMILILPLFTVIIGRDLSMMAFMTSWGTPLFAALVFSGENEKGEWEGYCLTLPISRNQSIIGRYLFIVCMWAATSLIAVALCALIRIFPLPLDSSFGPTMSGDICASALALMATAVILPFMTRFGTQGFPAPTVLICLSPTFITLAFPDMVSQAIGSVAALAVDGTGAWLLGGSVLLAAFSFIILSCCASIALYRHREF